MAHIHLPLLIRSLAGDVTEVDVAASNVGEVICHLEAIFPGTRDRLCSDQALRPGLAVAVDNEVSSRGLDQPLEESSEVHFLPAIGGG